MNIVVSVNVGLPRNVEWQGKTVRTAIWKEPVAGRVFAGRLNLAGDGQADLAGHGGEQRAVMVYQLDSYRYWASHLGRSDFVHGIFGENLTVEGLADSEVCIGDRYRIGSAVFEVSQPRVTCYRLGLRLNHPEMPALVVSHRRPGFYFRVIEEGEIGAGDRIEKIADGAERMSVVEIDGLLYSADHPIEALRRATRIPALSPGWQGSFRALLDATEHGNVAGNAGLSPVPAMPLAWRGFRPLKVVATRQESQEVRSFELAAQDGSSLPGSLPGQYIIVKVRPAADRPAGARNYSLCGPPEARTYRIGVKNEGGGVSAFLHQHIQVEDILEISAPRGGFTLKAGTTPIVLLSAGVGVTPLLAMLHAAASSDGASPREVWWIHTARNAAYHSFASEAQTLVAGLKQGHQYTIYSRPGDADRLGVDYDRKGHLALPLLSELGVPKSADFYLCGPGGFLAEIDAGLTGWGVDPHRIHKEPFGPAGSRTPGMVGAADQSPPHMPVGPEGSGPLVSFAKSRLAVRWDSRFNSLLELAEACSVPVRWACRTGVCHNCESGLIDGSLRYSPEPIDPPAEGIALICCSLPVSDIELDL
jgi:ferredoxin-NADP reductase/MOSC domain-containing protein YiiM/ferredoxin